jgi:hypothetical protein
VRPTTSHLKNYCCYKSQKKHQFRDYGKIKANFMGDKDTYRTMQPVMVMMVVVVIIY